MASRRDFIKQSAVLGMGAVISPDFFTESRLQMGLQLFTVNKEMKTDLVNTVKKVAAMGYTEVETYAFNTTPVNSYWNVEVKALQQIFDNNGIRSISGHYDLSTYIMPGKTDDDLKRYVDHCIQGALVLKQEYIVWPWLNPELRNLDTYKQLANKLNRIGEQIKQADLQLAYHNHGFEFDLHDGQKGYDIILNETDQDLVKIELDIYWFSHSSKIPVHEYFKKFPGRFPLIHFKDMDRKNRDLHTVLGAGSIDFKPYIADYNLAGVKHVMVEQGNNYVPDVFDCISRSAKYMKENLLFP
ncbi:sugar phosphate isomerase/epimerase [Pedobacter sp. CAN_A7]|uniref:sugar phosphate isomerase/epimerase family protein n=1 Tax=Pedobacter sp. CAN_A7 TaxID=2787722 RepID=UPI0018CAC70E